MSELVTIRRYRDLSEAIVARSLVESTGITVYLYDENLIRLDWQISNFIGGIRLQVEQTDEIETTELLSQTVPDSIEFGGDTAYKQPHCPNCDSANITYQGHSRKAALTSLYLFSLPLPLGRETWRCDVCNTLWEDSGE